MKRNFFIVIVLAALIVLCGCSVTPSQPAANLMPEVSLSNLGGGYGLAFDSAGALYAAGKDNGKFVVWKRHRAGNQGGFYRV